MDEILKEIQDDLDAALAESDEVLKQWEKPRGPLGKLFGLRTSTG